MKVFKTRWFVKWAKKEKLSELVLLKSAEEMLDGLFDAELGGAVFKKRVALGDSGKRGGARTLLAYKDEGHIFFMYGFKKNERDNISSRELEALKLLAKELLRYCDNELIKAMDYGELVEI